MPESAAPDGFHSVTPYLIVASIPPFIPFLERAFGAEELDRDTLPDGSVLHAKVRIGDSMVMMGQARGEYAPMPSMLYLYVADVDATYARALEAGGKSLREPVDEPYGDRVAGVKDPMGNEWWIATAGGRTA